MKTFYVILRNLCWSQLRKLAEESQEQQENRLAADRESKHRKRAEELQEQRENRLAASRDNANKGSAICIYVSKIKKKMITETKNVKTGNCINISKYFYNRLK